MYAAEQEYLRCMSETVHATVCIQRTFKKAIVDPMYLLCCKRLQREYAELSSS
jgi:hypothetical protein